MSPTAVVPTWLVVLLSVGTPLLTFVAALLANAVSRKGAVELERRSRREESMRHLKWAAELAVSDDDRRAQLGSGPRTDGPGAP